VTAPVRPELCNRLRGGSVRDCVCRLPAELGWLDCPPDAQGLLEPIEPPRPPKTMAEAAIDMVEDNAAVIGGLYPAFPRASFWDKPAPALVAPRLSGDICDSCGSPNLQWAGTCKVCRDCGSSAGGCS
jgi:hypothetical protein